MFKDQDSISKCYENERYQVTSQRWGKFNRAKSNTFILQATSTSVILKDSSLKDRPKLFCCQALRQFTTKLKNNLKNANRWNFKMKKRVKKLFLKVLLIWTRFFWRKNRIKLCASEFSTPASASSTSGSCSFLAATASASATGAAAASASRSWPSRWSSRDATRWTRRRLSASRSRNPGSARSEVGAASSARKKIF